MPISYHSASLGIFTSKLRVIQPTNPLAFTVVLVVGRGRRVSTGGNLGGRLEEVYEQTKNVSLKWSGFDSCFK